MKLWDSLATCLILLSAARTSPPPEPGRAAESPLELPPIQISLSVNSPGISSDETPTAGETYSMEKPISSEFEDVVDFIKVTISRIRRSPSSAASSPTSSTSSPPMEKLSSRTRNRREKKKGASPESGQTGRGRSGGGRTGRRMRGGGGRGRGHSCMLRQIHLNVSDLGLGYLSSEEMIFRYCSGPCRKSETNYDKILYNLVHNRKLPLRDTPPQACCRPIAFDDDLSFLDDSLIYHTVRKHSARKCGCV
ncbi:glial cell line-derived neurotrophic factor [Salarias fasciatus]|uniref:Glial cell line-derived neurotrophic factor n=1 Tax=Salarias fasciatus TaxID=181472 RepID=A0A672I511_SALFA|nr:glial cell line-derived neurotrophic factor-like [Salarias fasciatus]